jgi:putative ABC transport system ATP-binding protein
MNSDVMISTQNLTKSFGQAERKIEVLRGIDFSLSRGISASLLGRSGSGKSTLLALLAGLDQPNGGDLVVAGVRLNGLGERELTEFRAQNVGVIFQHFHLLSHLNALENIALALEVVDSSLNRTVIKERSLLMLQKVGLSDRAHHLPAMLSGGEKQRVAIGRALVTRPQVLLADEPSGSLDQQTGQEVMELIFQLVKNEGSSLVLVTHDESLARRCDQVWKIDQGRIERC